MDIFDALEQRVEALVARKKALEEENASLRAEVARLTDEQKTVATRLDGLLEKLQEVEKRRPLQEKNYYKTHPYVPDRIRTVKEEMGERIDFDDYINVEQQPHK